MNIAVAMAFDGSRYCGFQVQSNGLSVCQAFQDALQDTLGSRPDVKGCSRTDSGVHALEYVLNFHADTRIPLQRLPLALNAHLPLDIRVQRVWRAPEDFHARYAAHSKTYVYRLWNSPLESPFTMNYSHTVARPLDVEAMRQAAALVVGRHDFSAFCAAGSSAAAHGDTVRTVSECTVSRRAQRVDITVTADGYLYNMMRILAGTLVQVGLGKLPPARLPAILQSGDRAQAGPTLPARGLFLKKVSYPDTLFEDV